MMVSQQEFMKVGPREEAPNCPMGGSKLRVHPQPAEFKVFIKDLGGFHGL
jgi:hypothetical protein